MKVLMDTSVLLAAFLPSHPQHACSLAWLQVLSRGCTSQ